MAESMFETHIARVNRQVVSMREGVEERVKVGVMDLGQKLGTTAEGIRILRELSGIEGGGVAPLDVALTLISASLESLAERNIISGTETTIVFAIAVDSARRRQEREGR